MGNMNFNFKSYSPTKPSSTPAVTNDFSIDFNILDYKADRRYVTNSKDPVTVSSSLDLDDYLIEENYVNESSITNETEKMVEEIKMESEVITHSTRSKLVDFSISFFGAFLGEFLNLGEGFIDSHIYGTTKTINALRIDKAAGWKDGYDDIIIGKDVSKIVKERIQRPLQDEKNRFGVKMGNQIGDIAGNILGYRVLSSIPYVGILATTFAGAGKRTEQSINEQMEKTGCVNDWHVFFKSLGGSLEGFAAGKLRTASKSSATASTGSETAKKGIFKIFSKFAKPIKNKVSNVYNNFSKLASKTAAKYTKKTNVVNILWGIDRIFKKGFIKENIKALPKIFTSTGLDSLVSRKVWFDTAGKSISSFVSVLEGNFPKGDEIVFRQFLITFGKDAAKYLANFR